MFRVGSFSRRLCPIAVLFLLLGLSHPMPLGAQGAGGVIAGVVTDAQGGVLPGVTLTARNTETGVVRTTVTEADGRYRLIPKRT